MTAHRAVRICGTLPTCLPSCFHAPGLLAAAASSSLFGGGQCGVLSWGQDSQLPPSGKCSHSASIRGVYSRPSGDAAAVDFRIHPSSEDPVLPAHTDSRCSQAEGPEKLSPSLVVQEAVLCAPCGPSRCPGCRHRHYFTEPPLLRKFAPVTASMCPSSVFWDHKAYFAFFFIFSA